MFKFNISEEIIFNIKNGFNENNFLNNENKDIFQCILKKLKEKNVLILYGKNYHLRDKISLNLIYSFFNENVDYSNISVYRVNCVEELEELYLEDKFQIFYLDDFYGKIRFNINGFNKYIFKINSQKNKILIVNVRKSIIERIEKLGLNKYLENLNEYSFINGNSNEEYGNIDFISLKYDQMSYLDKFVLFSIFVDNVKDLDLWSKVTRGYFLDSGILNENIDFNDEILNSFKKLEFSFIFIDSNYKFKIKNVFVKDFLLLKFSQELELIKDLFNNIRCYFSFIEMVSLCEKLNIKFKYTEEEYNQNLKQVLHEIVYSDNIKNILDLLEFVLGIFKIIDIIDYEIIEYLNNKIIYLNMDVNDVIKYFLIIKNNKNIIIKNEKFKNKMCNLLYQYEVIRDFEFYNYSFKYFLFVSELVNLYNCLDDEDVLEIKNNFHRLLSIILNNVNLHFNLHQFSLNVEFKQALIELKMLINDFNIRFIFSENVYEIFYNIKYKLLELLESACEFIPEDKQDYYIFTYFENELERNKYFIENTFDDINVDLILSKIKENMCKYES